MQYKLTSLILCGGKGSRLKKLGKKKPKCLVKIKGKYFIEYILSVLELKNVEKIIISGFYKYNILKKNNRKI